MRLCIPRALEVADILPSFSESTFWICSHSSLFTDIGGLVSTWCSEVSILVSEKRAAKISLVFAGLVK